jgi:hypothetical protein
MLTPLLHHPVVPYNTKQSLYIHAHKREREKNRKEIAFINALQKRKREYVN